MTKLLNIPLDIDLFETWEAFLGQTCSVISLTSPFPPFAWINVVAWSKEIFDKQGVRQSFHPHCHYIREQVVSTQVKLSRASALFNYEHSCHVVGYMQKINSLKRCLKELEFVV